MKTSLDINNLLESYTLPELIKLKLAQIADQKKELSRQEDEARGFLVGNKKTGRGRPKLSKTERISKIDTANEKNSKRRRAESPNTRASKIRAVIRSAGLKGITNNEIADSIEWGNENHLSPQQKRLKVNYATKQMVKQAHIKVHKDTPNRFYM